MAEYNFESLSPYDFEVLCRDLLQRDLGVRLQAFKTGRDGGIDLRYAISPERSLVVQCKHYAGSSLSTLMSRLRNSEVAKVRELDPARYVFMTSLGLTPANHDAIVDVFSPHCRSAQDVYGKEDLNNLLSRFPDLERTHFKLWLTSTSVLQRVLHNASYVQSAFEREEIENRLRVYVQVPSVELAQKMLEETHACIISGIPGIGKTTLAHILLVQYLVDGWEIVTVRQNVAEALDRYDEDRSRKQVFWYDDFLGQTSLGDKLAKNEDRGLIQLIKSISKHPNRRFILTTREYILKQAEDCYELLSRADLELHKHMLTLGDYSLFDRARILANHLYFNDVPEEHIKELLTGRKYRSIVEHRNYSPRIVQWLTDVSRTSACSPTEYCTIFLETLDNPVRLWEHAFRHQLSEKSRQLLITLANCGQMVPIEDLRHAYENLCKLRTEKYSLTWTSSDFGRAIRELEGTFVSVRKCRSMTVVCFNNPSIMDYMVHYLEDNFSDLMDVVDAALYFEQIERFIVLSRGRSIVESDSGLPEHGAKFLEDVLKRTLDAPGCHVIQVHGSHGVDFVRTSKAKVVRLWHSLELGTLVGGIREYVLTQIDALATEVESYRSNRDDLVRLLAQGRQTKWIPQERVDSWREGMKDYLLGTPDAWCEVEALAEWYESWPNELSEEDADILVANLGKAIEEEVSYYLEDETDEDAIGGFATELESVAQSMGRDYSEEIGALEERVNEFWGGELESQAEEWHSDRVARGGSVIDIDSVFDSLLQ